MCVNICVIVSVFVLMIVVLLVLRSVPSSIHPSHIPLLFLFRFAFVSFEDQGTADKMMKKHDGAEVDGFQISLKYAGERNRDGGGRGGRTPEFGGRGRGGRGRG